MAATGVAIRRPLSVWIITLWNIVFAGGVPLVVTLSVLTLDVQQVGARPPLPEAFFSLGMALTLIVVSAGAWLGREWGRRGMLALVVVHYGWYAYRNLLLGLAYGAAGQIFWARMLWALLWLGLNFFYLGRPEARAFFEAGDKMHGCS